ncbi:hypothetical protein D3C81_1083430 [compost metagenome]
MVTNNDSRYLTNEQVSLKCAKLIHFSLRKDSDLALENILMQCSLEGILLEVM